MSKAIDAETQQFHDDLLESVRQMGQGMAARETHVELTEAASIRAGLGASQSAFASMLGVSLRTLQDWEQGRRSPSGAALTLLRLVGKSSEARRVLARLAA